MDAPPATGKMVAPETGTTQDKRQMDNAPAFDEGACLRCLDIELTHRCNLRCSHCYVRTDRAERHNSGAEAPKEFWLDLLGQAASHGCKRVYFTGGEPLLRYDFPDICGTAVAMGFQVSIATNATLVTDSLARMLGRWSSCCASVSVYGWDAESFLETTGCDRYEDFVTGVKYLRRHNVPIRLKSPPTRLLVGARQQINRSLRQMDYTETVRHSWELSKHSMRNETANDQINGLRLGPDAAARERLREPGEALALARAYVLPQSRLSQRNLFHCLQGDVRLAVDPWGRLQPCLTLRHPTVQFDLRHADLATALAQFIPRVRRLLVRADSPVARCIKCAFRPICKHCPATSWCETGALDGFSDYYCQTTQALGQFLAFVSVCRFAEPEGPRDSE